MRPDNKTVLPAVVIEVATALMFLAPPNLSSRHLERRKSELSTHMAMDMDTHSPAEKWLYSYMPPVLYCSLYKTLTVASIETGIKIITNTDVGPTVKKRSKHAAGRDMI
mmetsp:Transcript_19684/g.38109  ORF Transcript_19684/g.38109 Transcript_19684/m.38109 type:complete len:109 (-) Transcript_19684:173-499(-)